VSGWRRAGDSERYGSAGHPQAGVPVSAAIEAVGLTKRFGGRRAVDAVWAGLAISTRATDTRVAYQLSVLTSLPPVAVTALMSFTGTRS
jgi:hypothetical protein